MLVGCCFFFFFSLCFCRLFSFGMRACDCTAYIPPFIRNMNLRRSPCQCAHAPLYRTMYERRSMGEQNISDQLQETNATVSYSSATAGKIYTRDAGDWKKKCSQHSHCPCLFVYIPFHFFFSSLYLFRLTTTLTIAKYGSIERTNEWTDDPNISKSGWLSLSFNVYNILHNIFYIENVIAKCTVHALLRKGCFIWMANDIQQWIYLIRTKTSNGCVQYLNFFQLLWIAFILNSFSFHPSGPILACRLPF